MSTVPPPAEDVLAPAEHRRIFEERILPEYLSRATPVETPTLVMLGGQPGAGKSGLRRTARDEIRGSGEGCVTVDPDDLRGFHPRYLEHAERDPLGAANQVQQDAGQWAWELLQALLEKGYNVIQDTTLRSTEYAVATARLAGERGYRVQVHVVAVQKALSREGVRARFEGAIHGRRKWEETADPAYEPYRDAVPRWVDESFQDLAYDGLQDALEALEASGLCERVVVRDRAGGTLADTADPDRPADAASPSEALARKRESELTVDELRQYVRSLSATVERMEARGAEADAVATVLGVLGGARERLDAAMEAWKARARRAGLGRPDTS